MTGRHILKGLLSLVLLLTMTASISKAADESYIQSLSGALKKGDSCIVIDDKFLNLPLAQWNLIRNLSVENFITFELRQDTNIYYYNKAFSCTLNVSIKYYSTRDQLTPSEISNISLIVKYDTATGKFYPVYDRYAFKNAFKVTVVVNSIASQEWGNELPAIFRIKNQIQVRRKYPFSREVNAKLGLSMPDISSSSSAYRINPGTPVDNHLTISWDPNDFTNYSNGFGTPEEYDLEWTYIDNRSERSIPFTDGTVTAAQAEQFMRFDNTRVAVTSTTYKINLAFADGYIITRVRGAWNDDISGVRQTTNWQYLNTSGQVAFMAIGFHEDELNWQYTVSFAEEGKRKEVISYFDGSLRSRQAVTITNSDNIAVIAETIYDNMGRPAMSILPAPVNNNILKYYPAENKNEAGEPYSHNDITSPGPGNCSISSDGLNTSGGAAKYYSPNNAFIGDPDYYFTRYVPNSVATDSYGYPFTLTEYTPDNTGRIRRQGGVGYDFQIGSGRETNYFYGKPLQSELDRLFGMEMGNASHYLKNMVVDPNGQVSVSYVDAAGKTIATALAGVAPGNVDQLPSALDPESKKTMTQVLMRPGDFQTNPVALLKEASATFLVAVKNVPLTVHYSASPAAFGPWNGPVAGQQRCSNCYYDIEITVKDDCGNVVQSANTSAFQANDVVCNSNAAPFTGSLTFSPQKYGEYTVSYRLRLSEDVIKFQTDYYIANNIDLKKLQNFFEEELAQNNIIGCYTDCESCKKVGDFASFTQKVKDLLQKIKDEKYPADIYPDFDINSVYINTWITEQYNAIVANCQTVAANCIPSPCEQKLEMMKYDVRPGGQYALYLYDQNTGTYSIVDDGTNVLLRYDDGIAEIDNLAYEDDNGATVHIKEGGVYISVTKLIEEYLKHPEWADAFVKLHIEYCSYLWCKDAGNPVPAYNNEMSYKFDEKIREVIIKGQDAVAAGYYSTSNYQQLSQLDPFFNGGRGTSYKPQLVSDLENLSAVLRIRFKDMSGNYMPVKNIQQLLEWELYCKPTGEGATAADFINSWNCNPDANCRSLTAEWELYKNYYLKIKSKYVRLAKLDYDPSCENCFIGQDPVSAGICEDPGPLTDYVIAGGMINKKLFYRPPPGTENKPFKGNYKIKLRYTDGMYYYANSVKGSIAVDLSDLGQPGDPVWELIEVKCLNGSPQQNCDNGNGGGGSVCPAENEFILESRYCGLWDQNGVWWNECEIHLVRPGGPVSQTVEVLIQQTETYSDGNHVTTSFPVTITSGLQENYVGQSYQFSTGFPNPPYLVSRTFSILSVSCPGSSSSCPAYSNFTVTTSNYGTTFYPPCSYVDYHDINLVHNGGPVTQDVNVYVVHEVNNWYTGSTYYYEWKTLPAGQQTLLLGQYRTEYFDLNDNCIQEDNEITTHNYYVLPDSIYCPPSGFTCPSPGSFSADYSSVCYSDGALLTITYTGTSPSLPFPANKKVTVTCQVTTNTGTSTVSVLINNYSGTGSTCIGGKGISILSLLITGVTCEEIVVPPSSTCADDPRALLYGTKIRIWNEYVDETGYIDCMISTGPADEAEANAQMAASIVVMREAATENLDALKQNWIETLKGVRDEEFPSLAATTLSDAVINTLADNLYLVAKKYIEIAPKENIRGASTLPVAGDPGYTSTIYATNGYNNFTEVFAAYIGISLMQQGFGPHLLDQPYPYNRTPLIGNPNGIALNPVTCTTLTALKNRWIAAGSPGTFHSYLRNELKDDFILTVAELTDIENRCANSPAICKLLSEPVSLPVALSRPIPSAPLPAIQPWAWADCSSINSLYSSFATTYPNVTTGTKLYRNLLPNFLNANLGFALSYYEYEEFKNTACVNNSAALLYNKPASPLIAYENDIVCMDNIFRNVFDKAGQEYEIYIEEERRKFRNAYISKCLSNNASAKLEGEQYEYHYTLYYYDQSGNLVKTIPPEGVALLSDAELELVEEFRPDDPSVCTGTGIPASENATATFNALSTGLQSASTHGTEMWLYSSNPGTTRQVRVITPDHKYFYQAAIYQNKLWVELYTLEESGSVDDEISITLSNEAVADLSALPPLQSWSHLQIQSTGSLTGGTLQLYLDGRKLTNMAGTLPPYPFDWEINSSTGSYTLPSQDLSALKHFRIYDRIATEAEVWANYKNSCLAPVGALAVQSAPLQYWGRFNIPAPGSATTTGPGSTVEYVSRFIVPDHGLPTNYAYNSLNQVVKQSSTDGGASEFYYDRLGRLTISQNEEQKTPKIVDTENPANRFSYTKYDALGRIIEVGEKLDAVNVTETDTRDDLFLQTWLGSGSNRQVTVTAYDVQPVWAPASLLGTQKYLRKRVAASALLSESVPATDPSLNRVAASYYSYDLIGNVSTLVQENTALGVIESAGEGLKRMKYEYDLVSGKVNKVLYQDGKWDQFYYQYLYDADNRVVKALSSRINYVDPAFWVTEATYRYYLHGPLARMELGNSKVQGTDYAYTLQGWLKGVNSQFLDPDRDMSGDGLLTGNFTTIARDVFGFSLGYYNKNLATGLLGDYSPIGGAPANAFGLQYTSPPYDDLINRNFETGKDLFNGNISHATYAIKELENANTIGYSYRYDQLNRLTGMRRHNIGAGSTIWNNTGIINAYKEEITYDANGNIKTYLRNGADMPAGTNGNPTALPLEMDNMVYGYNVDNNGRLVNNKLRHVNDDPSYSDKYTEDIDNQGADNYQYDNIGNLISDNTEYLQRINWTVYGKIATILKVDGRDINYSYDAAGNRITKEVDRGGRGGTLTTYYVRDAQGNVMGIYTHDQPDGGATYMWKEQHLYGSSRIGMVNTNVTYTGSDAYDPGNDNIGNGVVGLRTYELSNHLGNVLAVINDIKTGFPDGHFEATVLSANDYYPFGMLQPGRKFSAVESYRYGFNGKENDNEGPIQYDYGFRIYDSRLVRFKSVDPLTNGYPELTPYQFASNRPIDGIDLDGLEYYTVHVRVRKENDGTNYVKVINVEDNTQMSDLQFANIHHRQFDPTVESKKYGNQGEGVLFIYYDMGGNKIGEGMMSSQSGIKDKIGRHGIWSGEGAPTDFGEGPQKNWEWDYSANPYVGMAFSKLKGIIQPIDEVDNIAFIHDEDQNRPVAPDGGHNNPINLESDIAFVANLMLYKERINDKNYKDEFTGKAASKEARRAAKRGLKYFMGEFSWAERRMAGKKYSKGEIPPKLEKRGMTKQQLKSKIEEVKNKIKQSGRKYGNANDVKL
ncbi:MAG: hypothetical protein JNK14_16035 [Chitinophagaceae bacterium]|nr:hypothetical protein [Chitinophagaceae bacterium]